jgi:hypothetical protein
MIQKWGLSNTVWNLSSRTCSKINGGGISSNEIIWMNCVDVMGFTGMFSE